MTNNRKRVRHYHEPGDFHELTFSCYRQMPLLTNDCWQAILARMLDVAIEKYSCQLVGFVFMPEHVHLLIYPLVPEPRIDLLLAETKQPCSVQIRQLLEKAKSPLLERLMVRERPGKWTFRFWQEGPGYDRNFNTTRSVLASLEYIHLNPVRRGLCERAIQWKWSSARYYLQEPYVRDRDLPKIHGLPVDFDCAELAT